MSFFCANFGKVCLTYHVSNMLLSSNAWNGLSVTDFIQNATPVALFVLILFKCNRQLLLFKPWGGCAIAHNGLQLKEVAD